MNMIQFLLHSVKYFLKMLIHIDYLYFICS